MSSMTPLQLIVILIVFSFSTGIIYGIAARLTERWLKQRGWQIRNMEEERIGWEPESIYNLPPDDEWLTIWKAYRKQRVLDRRST